MSRFRHLFIWVTAVIVRLLFPFGETYAQSADSLFSWNVTAKKISDKQYELQFAVTVKDGWQLYAPDQSILDIPTTELKFPDSAIKPIEKFTVKPDSKTWDSPIFQMPVGICTGQVTWSLPVRISGDVPASLSGELLYAYGRGDEFFLLRLLYQAGKKQPPSNGLPSI